MISLISLHPRSLSKGEGWLSPEKKIREIKSHSFKFFEVKNVGVVLPSPLERDKRVRRNQTIKLS